MWRTANEIGQIELKVWLFTVFTLCISLVIIIMHKTIVPLLLIQDGREDWNKGGAGGRRGVEESKEKRRRKEGKVGEWGTRKMILPSCINSNGTLVM